MVLLLSFFLVLFSMATCSTGKFSHARDSIQNEFSTMGLSTARKTLTFMYSLLKIKSALNPVFDPYLQDKTMMDEDLTTKNKTKTTQVYWAENETVDVSAKMGNLILLGVNAERQKQDLLLRIPTVKLFYPGEGRLTPAGKVLITNMLNIIKTDFDKITIHSYNDDGDAGADPFAKDSYVLSAERAYAVAKEITDQLQIPTEKIPFYGYGHYRSSEFSNVLGSNTFNNRIELWIRELWVDSAMHNGALAPAQSEISPTAPAPATPA